MRNNPECLRSCPRLLNAKEEAAQLIVSGVARPPEAARNAIDKVVQKTIEVQRADCERPRPAQAERPRLLGRLGVINTPSSEVYTCGVTGERTKDLYTYNNDKQ